MSDTQFEQPVPVPDDPLEPDLWASDGADVIAGVAPVSQDPDLFADEDVDDGPEIGEEV